MTDGFEIVVTPRARRAIEHELPEAVAAAAVEFIYGALRENPYRVGKRLREPMASVYAARRGEYRVLYRVFDTRLIVEVDSIAHRRAAYRR
ncbi:MAG TPA: type II toxin-antitoxin system RelE/ParE family toxin [Microlunatus sp.]